MKARMERILKKLAQRHAPYLLNNVPADMDERLRLLADGLAKNGVLVIVAEVPSDNFEQRVSEWVGAYGDMYFLLVQALFPSLAHLDPVYADDNRPPIVVVEGQPAALMAVLGGYVAPYLALRQRDKLVSEAELRGVMQFILDELEASDLPQGIYTQLWREGVKVLHRLLRMQVTHYAVTSFARPLFQQIQQEQLQVQHSPQPNKPEQHRTPPPPPEMLPEEPPVEETDSAELFQSNIPMFLSTRKKGETGRLPPVPLPPKRKKPDS